MWRLQHKRLFDIPVLFTPKRTFFLKLCGIVFVCHVLLLLFATFLYKPSHEYERFDTLNRVKTELIVFCPLQKKLKDKKNNKSFNKNKEQKIIGLDQYQKSLMQQKAKGETRKESVSVISVKKPSLQIAREKRGTKAVKSSRVVQKDNSKSSEISLEVVEHEEIVIEIEVQKQVKQEKVAALENQDVKDKSVEIKQELPVQQAVLAQVTSQEVEPLSDDIDLEDVTFVGYQELESLKIGQQIQSVIEQCFKPPLGVAQGISCECCVSIDGVGRASRIVIQKSSKVPAFDIASRSCLQKVSFPQEVRNKTIIIVLGH